MFQLTDSRRASDGWHGVGIPRDIDEAAYLDGCNKWQLFWHIILPVSKSALATLMITDFLSTWNEHLLASVIINDNKMKTVPVDPVSGNSARSRKPWAGQGGEWL